jgi:hypothetical protein
MYDYCRAYRLSQLRAFPGWVDLTDPAGVTDQDPVVYLGHDLRVVSAPLAAEPRVLRDDPTPQWQEFCTSTLDFRPPDDASAASPT